MRTDWCGTIAASRSRTEMRARARGWLAVQTANARCAQRIAKDCGHESTSFGTDFAEHRACACTPQSSRHWRRQALWSTGWKVDDSWEGGAFAAPLGKTGEGVCLLEPMRVYCANLLCRQPGTLTSPRFAQGSVLRDAACLGNFHDWGGHGHSGLAVGDWSLIKTQSGSEMSRQSAGLRRACEVCRFHVDCESRDAFMLTI